MSHHGPTVLVANAFSLADRIHLIRGVRVMLGPDLKELYGAAPKVLTQAVRRNATRFPADFMFILTSKEWSNLGSLIVTSIWGGVR